MTYPTRTSFDALLAEFPGEFSLSYGRISNGDTSSVATLNASYEAPFASVTKLFTSLAILVGVEEGSVRLSDSVQGTDIALEELLSHSGGLATDGKIGEVSSLRVAERGRRRIYSNLGFQLAGKLLEDATGMSFGSYLREAVLLPGGMSKVRYDASGDVAEGLGSASGLCGTAEDLVALVRLMTAPIVLSDTTLRAFRTPYLPDLPGVLPGFGLMKQNPWGLGCEIAGHKSPHWRAPEGSPSTFGHFGRSGSIVWVDLESEVFMVSLSAVPFGGWAVALWPRLATEVLRALS